MNQQKTQGERIADLLRPKYRTSMEIQRECISTCWWKRLDEYLARNPKEKLVKKPGPQGLTLYRIQKAA
jgi:hypothetical protein